MQFLLLLVQLQVNSMIISNLIGGLGNQMFQYACGRALSLRTRQAFKISTDQFKQYKQHNGFEINRVFNLNAQEVTSGELKELLGFRSDPKIRRMLGHSLMSWIRCKNWYGESSFNYSSNLNKIIGPAYLQGYWQSERYFIDVSNVIRKDFTFANIFQPCDIAIINKMKAGPCASLHVRRGDYLKGKSKNIYATCDNSYYVSAVKVLRKKNPDINLFVFSDDPEWVIKYLKPSLGNVEIVSHNSGERSSVDMQLMSMADHHVIANSSFSWWGAWLNPSISKTVIAPKIWFADGRLTPDLIPSSWIQL